MIEKFITNLFRQPQKESNLTPEKMQCKKTFELTGITEKIEKLRDGKTLKYLENEPAHVEYNPDRIDMIFDYYKYENRIGPVEKFRKISIRKYRNNFQLNYQDLREDNQSFDFISEKPTEILEKINEIVVKINGNKK